MNDFDAGWPNTWAETIWDPIREGCGEGVAAVMARKELLLRYHEVVQRYFRDQIRDPHTADELYSNFAVKLMESDRLIRGASPERGRFRHYLKAALRNMVTDHYREKARRPAGPLPPDPTPDPRPDPRPDPFPSIAQEVLLNKAWAALRAHDEKTRQHHYAVLRRHSDNPGVRSAQHAERLSSELGKPFTADGFRTALKRARARFACLLLEEVQSWSEAATTDELEEAVIELQLLPYCQDALAERRMAAVASPRRAEKK